MKPHPHIRKTIKWGGALLALLLLTLWITSRWRSVSWGSGGRFSFGLSRGAVSVMHNGSAAARSRYAGLVVTDVRPKPDATPAWSTFPGGWLVLIPLSGPTLVSIAAACVAWRLDVRARRRANAGLCQHCQYDRAGLAPGAVCPECGRLPA